ncbi:MAG: DNA polymerase sliding clamp [Thermoproteus sp.]
MSLAARALFPKGKEPRYAFEALISMLPEVTLNFSADGISMKALDPSKVALLQLDFAAGGLEEYSIEHDVKIGLILSAVKDALKRVGAAEKLEIGVDEERQRFLMFVYPKKGREVGLHRKFSFPIVQLAEEEIPEINVEYDASFLMDSAVFDDIMALAENVSDTVTIQVSQDSVVFTAEGEGGRGASTELGQDSESVYEINSSGAVKAKYSVELIRNVSGKLKGISKRVKVELGDAKPLRLTYEFATGTFAMILAPRAD